MSGPIIFVILFCLLPHLVKVQPFTLALIYKRSNFTKPFLRLDKNSLIMYHKASNYTNINLNNVSSLSSLR